MLIKYIWPKVYRHVYCSYSVVFKCSVRFSKPSWVVFPFISYWDSIYFLSAAKKLLKRTEIVDPSKHKDKEKRSIEIDQDNFVDLDNGKDLLVAYLGGISDYRRQTRSVKDEEDEDFESDDGKSVVLCYSEPWILTNIHWGNFFRIPLICSCKLLLFLP